MSNHRLQRVAELARAPSAQRHVAEIVIRLLPTGQVQVTAPLHLTDLCEQMLDEAHKVVKSFRPASSAEEQAIEGDSGQVDSAIVQAPQGIIRLS